MKRQSTTAKVTHATSRRIMAECSNGSGVIIRHRGKEYGVTRVIRTSTGYVAKTWEGITLALSGCTIRKTTISNLASFLPTSLTFRTRHTLTLAGFDTLAKVWGASNRDLIGVRNFGHRNLDELQEAGYIG